MLGRLALSAVAVVCVAHPVAAQDILVSTQAQYERAADEVEAGNTIVLADGEWRDFEIVITGEGRADAPITLRAQTPGGVILTGQSNLRIGGEHVVVSGLVFRDGYSPTGEVISFRRDSDDLARNSRVTETVIDGFSKPNRTETDYWVGIYGQNNRFDHNHLSGKTNAGVTLAVRLNTEESRENDHRIDHNYFGPRPNLGSNGGETLRIGTSHYAQFASNTTVENNVFDRTSGEVEIISSKSGGNTLRGNLFLRSRGGLTLRHGDGNLVEGNVFLGQGVDHTGGIRVINQRQTVRGNYMEGLRGTGFASALTVMNGVPNSPANRYVQVVDAEIERNTIIDSTRITLGAGADEERSAAPVDTSFASNLMSGQGEGPFIRVDADVSGIDFANNAVLSGVLDDAVADLPRADSEMVRAANGLLYPTDTALADIGVPRDMRVLQLSDVGIDWYPKPGEPAEFGSGQRIVVGEGASALLAAMAGAQDGDQIVLSPGTYEIDRTIPVAARVAVSGSPDGETVITFARPTLFELQTGGGLRLSDLTIDGAAAPDSSANAVIRTSTMPVSGNLAIEMDGVTVRNLDVNSDFDVIYFGASTLADSVRIIDSTFTDISGTVVSAASEADDQGRYNVEYLDIEGSQFRNVRGGVADVYRGGRDESTFGPHVGITGSSFVDVGEGSGASLTLHGVQRTEIARNRFESSAPIAITHTVGVPVTALSNNDFVATPEPLLTEMNYPGEPRVEMVDNTYAAEVGQ
ncbi:polysaccharide lyase 6 family protein [Aurantiacibacter aquimixticola]|uniref:Alginate lyase n=1 Tax=Aurantiacibacter aquimixticola TaxID=1958945 RepID=A0A419RW41_9SPHN|nr:polysaccharide lyase 6 family protein [Aurantiacibacter aquimixticola]RJY10006.1 alginate lyase [Aurantiacibacter aquimixticola]